MTVELPTRAVAPSPGQAASAPFAAAAALRVPISAPPPRRRGLVPRPALVERLAGADDVEVALLVAPAGYGKSSLLREWSEQDERPFVWLSGADLRLAATVQGSAPVARFRDRRERSLVLALDDAHLVHPVILEQLVQTVLTQLPTGSTLALACRADPELPLGRLRAHRELIELTEADLAMTPAEVGLMLRRSGIQLEDPEAAEAITRRTEGWPVGVYLATLSLQRRLDDPDGWRQFGGSDHLVAEYFRDEVLSTVSPHVLDFMTQSSVLDELSGPVCDAVLEREGSARLLSAVAEANLFLRPTDAAHQRFRWHRMFRETLRAELGRAQPERVVRLHRRASAWLYERGDIDGAIDHAVAGDDPPRAGDLLVKNLAGYLGQGRTATVQGWLRGFNDETIAGCPRLALVAAHSALATGDTAQAQRWRMAVGACTGGAAADERSTTAGAFLVEAMSARAGVAAIGEAASRAYQLDGAGGSWRPLACLLRGVAHYLSGAREAAIELLEEGTESGDGVTPAVTALCRAQRATIAIELQDWEDAAELTDRACLEIDRPGLVDQPVCALVFAAAAAARAHNGRSDEAKGDLRRGIDLLTELGDFLPWYGAEARLLLARASLQLADVVRARTLLAEASRFARRCGDAVVFRQWLDDSWARIDTLAETSLSGPSALTIAELRILRFLPSHRSFKEIAIQLGVSANTVKTQAHAVYRKLGAAS
ncbi:MAG TPA: LuxR C-terminal-related transcriptional regulator, partial [Solirubrobacteraceae bacterium]